MKFLEHIFFVWLVIVPVNTHLRDNRSLDDNRVLDHLLRLERTVTLLKKELEDTKKSFSKKQDLMEEENTALNKKLLSMNVTTSERLNEMTRGMTGSVSFEVRQRASVVSVGQNEVLKFDEVTLNRGGAYNPKSGIFIAPMNGTYIFWANVMSADTSNFSVRLYKEGILLLQGYTSRVITHGTAPLMYITRVSRGEHVWFANDKGSAGTKIYGVIYSSYGGTLLTKV